MTRAINAMSFTASVGVLLGFGAMASAQRPTAGESPSARIAKRIDALLQPNGSAAAAPDSGPVNWRAAPAVEQPQLRPIVYKGTPPSPPAPSLKRAVPRAVSDASPPLGDGKLPALPKPLQLPTHPLAALPTVDVESPLPLPILAHPKQDRATLDDVTLETSQAAALHPSAPAAPSQCPSCH